MSKDAQFENNGIGAQTKIPYGEDFTFYKRHLIQFYHSADTTGLIRTLLEIWDREVFSNHNKRKGHTGGEDAEVIDMDADPHASEIAESMARVRLQMAAQSNIDPPAVLPHPIPQPIVPDGIQISETDDNDFDDIYGDEVPPSPDRFRPGSANLPVIVPAPTTTLNPPVAAQRSPDPGAPMYFRCRYHLTIIYAALIPRQEESQDDSDGQPSGISIVNPIPTTTARPPPKSRQAAQKQAPIPKATRSRGAKIKVSALTVPTVA